jgi:hypothetical protein
MKRKNLRVKTGCIIFILFVLCLGQVFPQQCGDVDTNGIVNIVDALIIAQAYVGFNPTIFVSSVADVNADGGINIVDALIVAQYYVGLVLSLNCSAWTAAPTTVPTPTQVTTPPATGAPGSADCSTQETWSANVTYVTSGRSVIHNGNLYESRWYTVDQDPELFHGPADPWTLIGACDPNTAPGPTIPPIPGANGYATRFWDCCKPHCSWPNNPPPDMPPLQTCARDGISTQSDTLLESSCSGGPAYVCYKLIPWAVNANLSYGYAATSSGDICGRCFEIEFTGECHYGRSPGAEAIQGKKMIVQAINIGYDVDGGQVDIMIPGGGVGLFDGCSTQWGISKSELGAQYGGLLSACQEEYGYQDLAALKNCLRAKNDALFRSRGLTQMAQGLDWFIDWYEAADNPNIITKEVPCPPELETISGMQRP